MKKANPLQGGRRHAGEYLFRSFQPSMAAKKLLPGLLAAGRRGSSFLGAFRAENSEKATPLQKGCRNLGEWPFKPFTANLWNQPYGDFQYGFNCRVQSRNPGLVPLMI